MAGMTPIDHFLLQENSTAILTVDMTGRISALVAVCPDRETAVWVACGLSKLHDRPVKDENGQEMAFDVVTTQKATFNIVSEEDDKP